LDLAQLRQARGDVDAAVEALKGVVAHEPAHEEAQTELIRLYAESGHRHRALRQYQHLREALHRDLDVEPAAASRRLYESILAGRFPPARPSSTPASFGSARPRVRQGDGERGAVYLVGRDAQLETLEERLDSLFAGHGGLVMLEGEAGIGKSRLVAEVAERVQRRGGIALLGGAYHQEGQLPYGPFMEALEPVGGGVAPGGVRAVFGDAVGDLARLTPSTVSEIRADRQRLFASIADLLRGLAAESPILLALDDLHDADEASLQLLHYLVRTTRNDPVLLLGTFRPEEAPRTSVLGQLVSALHRQQWVDRVQLGRLDRRESEVLVVGLLDNGPVDRTVIETVHRLAAGNPFFTEEVVRSLRDTGRLRRIEGRWELLGDDVPLDSPALDLLAARLQRLGPAAAQMLTVAAVVGREVSYSLLRAATDLPDSTVLDALDVCLEHLVLEETPEGYRFGHPLQREIVYQRLSGARRMHLHARMAVALERIHAGRLEDQAETLAYHWAMSEDSGRAVPYLIQAGDRAAAVFANEGAISNYERALELLDSQDVSEPRQLVEARLQEKIGDLRAVASETLEAEEAYGAAIAALRQEPVSEEDWLARLHRKAAYTALTRHDVDAAAPHLAMAEAILSNLTDSVERGRVRLVSALVMWEQGNHADGRAAAEESLELA
ncbi:MAG: AAA family ATPase, partial [Chloroflexi bacterium]|nr:AAA family ATPase [Chloroflexota bacterium]